MKNLHLKLIRFLIIVTLLYSCNNRAELSTENRLKENMKDSILKIEKVKLDFDTLADSFKVINTITFQQRDSNMIYLASNYTIFDIEKINSTKFNIKLDIGLIQNYQLNLHSEDSDLLKVLTKSFPFGEHYLIFKLKPSSFRSTTIQDDKGGLTKLIIGDGDLLKAIEK